MKIYINIILILASSAAVLAASENTTKSTEKISNTKNNHDFNTRCAIKIVDSDKFKKLMQDKSDYQIKLVKDYIFKSAFISDRNDLKSGNSLEQSEETSNKNMNLLKEKLIKIFNTDFKEFMIECVEENKNTNKKNSSSETSDSEFSLSSKSEYKSKGSENLTQSSSGSNGSKTQSGFTTTLNPQEFTEVPIMHLLNDSKLKALKKASYGGSNKKIGCSWTQFTGEIDAAIDHVALSIDNEYVFYQHKKTAKITYLMFYNEESAEKCMNTPIY
ncbi:hypothetical protein BB561_003467 [Smittium simulii]|uniref:Uncharacterized protein n=1 Tax=Smittium simulii TaxID=133385 RepID=A0A2T9YL91_9FUNG|nr:hypothetical protein BB561_003467 [Smittium simulii]